MYAKNLGLRIQIIGTNLHPALINLPSAMIVQLTSIVIVDVEK
ncbi:Uncharacterised protein [Segatella copri]|jgi:hypothetical protein|nr:Uncharacterised protein [Segatella copri]